MTRLEIDLAALPANLRLMPRAELARRYNYMAAQLDAARAGRHWHYGRGTMLPPDFRHADGTLATVAAEETQRLCAAVLAHFGTVPCMHCGRLVGRDEHRSPLFTDPFHFGCGLEAAREAEAYLDAHPSPEEAR